MKKVGLLTLAFALMFTFSATGAHAWDICLKDNEYSEEYWISLSGPIIAGQVIFDASPFGAITGSLVGGAAFAIEYLGDTGLRYYVLVGSTWYTWAIISSSSEFYDTPRIADMAIPCPVTMDGGEAGSGACE